MRESQERLASIEDVDETTFARFAEYLYTGDYNTLQPVRSQETFETIQSFETANCEDTFMHWRSEKHQQSRSQRHYTRNPTHGEHLS